LQPVLSVRVCPQQWATLVNKRQKRNTNPASPFTLQWEEKHIKTVHNKLVSESLC
jgi:hypothetical protein